MKMDWKKESRVLAQLIAFDIFGPMEFLGEEDELKYFLEQEDVLSEEIEHDLGREYRVFVDPHGKDPHALLVNPRKGSWLRVNTELPTAKFVEDFTSNRLTPGLNYLSHLLNAREESTGDGVRYVYADGSKSQIQSSKWVKPRQED